MTSGGGGSSGGGAGSSTDTSAASQSGQDFAPSAPPMDDAASPPPYDASEADASEAAPADAPPPYEAPPPAYDMGGLEKSMQSTAGLGKIPKELTGKENSQQANKAQPKNNAAVDKTSKVAQDLAKYPAILETLAKNPEMSDTLENDPILLDFLTRVAKLAGTSREPFICDAINQSADKHEQQPGQSLGALLMQFLKALVEFCFGGGDNLSKDPYKNFVKEPSEPSNGPKLG